MLEQDKNEGVVVILLCENQLAKLSLVRGMTEIEFKRVCAEYFKKKPENFLSVLSHSGEVLNVSKLLSNPRVALGGIDKQSCELTIIFAESEDDPPRKRQKMDGTTINTTHSTPDEGDLTKEDKVKRLFTKLSQEPDVQIVEQTYQLAQIPGANTSGHVFLNDLIDIKRSTCLNESRQHKWQNILLNDNNLYLASDCDEQLLITISFRRNVRIHSIKINAPSIPSAPKTINLYANQSYMDFNNVHDIPPTQVLSITPKNFQPDNIINLNSIKFSKVNSLVLFVVDNQGGSDTSIIEQILFIGKPS